jgi:hypothetical protein
MSAPGRPERDYPGLQHEAAPVNPPDRPTGEYRSAQHPGTPVPAARRPLDGVTVVSLEHAIAAPFSGCGRFDDAQNATLGARGPQGQLAMQANATLPGRALT